ECGGATMRHAGFGTERLEEDVRKVFDGFGCRRMDSDSMRSLAEYETTLADFRSGKTHILLGTQMIAKGLDFPNVRVVGVINADAALGLPDFRAAERTFQLVAQVAGRTGRGEHPGRALVQTQRPDDPALVAAVTHDYAAFAGPELELRKRHDYPPFSRLVRIIVRAPEEKEADVAARAIAAALKREPLPEQSMRLLGPAAAPVPRARDRHRRHLQLLVPKGFPLAAFLDDRLQSLKLPANAEYAVDVDALNLL
ncbi:MAG TPA: helicase-related protein, partial [Planctomycetia bacterium]|nr:helicase-related protein [Planctomycetia bacterium]